MDNNTKFKDAINRITKIIKSNYFTYEQTKYIFTQVRKNIGLKAKKKTNVVREHLTPEEAKRLIEVAYNNKTKYGLMLKVLLFTGARVSEFINIKVEDVYLTEKKIYLRHTKGDKPRYVPIFDFYLDELRMFIGDRQIGYLFETRLNDKYSVRAMQKLVKKFAQEAGITKRVYPHQLRRTIATWLREKGVSTETIQQFLGHSKLETTQIYTAGAVSDLSEIGSKLLIEKKEED